MCQWETDQTNKEKKKNLEQVTFYFIECQLLCVSNDTNEKALLY